MGQKKEEVTGCQACAQKAVQEQDPDSSVSKPFPECQTTREEGPQGGYAEKGRRKAGDSGAGQVSSWNPTERFQTYIEVMCSAVSDLECRD